ncbi:PP2C family protein-serine/threonine phosphatase [Nocardioides salsibiostraticola]
MAAVDGLGRRCESYVRDRYLGWRTASTGSQIYVLSLLLGGVGVSFGVSLWEYYYMPLTAYFVWLLLGMMLLRFIPLVFLSGCAATAAVVAMVVDVDPIGHGRVAALITMAIVVGLILFQSSRQRSGLPGPLSEALLADLRDRLQAQGSVPDLPGEWSSTSAMLSAHGVRYAGDFVVAALDENETTLEMVLVDVCGKGVTAGAAALQFAGALGGLIGSIEQPQLFAAANRFLLRQESDEAFATAVHVKLNLISGDFAITSAGHPPAMRWSGEQEEWVLDNARGMALGIMGDPHLEASAGSLAPGEALMFYTDGVIESRDTDLDEGIAWLRDTARTAVGTGFDGAARSIVKQIAVGDDDRAVLILSRGDQPARGVVNRP